MRTGRLRADDYCFFLLSPSITSYSASTAPPGPPLSPAACSPPACGSPCCAPGPAPSLDACWYMRCATSCHVALSRSVADLISDAELALSALRTDSMSD